MEVVEVVFKRRTRLLLLELELDFFEVASNSLLFKMVHSSKNRLQELLAPEQSTTLSSPVRNTVMSALLLLELPLLVVVLESLLSSPLI